jgi:hypothetical protein
MIALCILAVSVSGLHSPTVARNTFGVATGSNHSNNRTARQPEHVPLLEKASPFVLAAGLFVLSYRLDSDAQENYELYLHTADPALMELYYTRSKRSQKFSTGFLIGAQATLLYSFFYAFGDLGPENPETAERIQCYVSDGTLYLSVNCWGLLDDE